MFNRTSLQKTLSLLFILAILFSGLPGSAVALAGDGLQRQVNAQTGKVSFLVPQSGRALPAAKALGTTIRQADPAMALAQRFAPEFGIMNPARELSVMKSNRPGDGRVIVHYQQQYQGIPVLGGELIVNTNTNGDLYSMSGEVSPGLALQTQPKVTAAQAADTALKALAKWYQKTPADFVVSTPELWVFDESLLKPSTRPAELVWRMEVTATDAAMPLRELVLVNAQRGSISLHFNQIDTAWHAAAAEAHPVAPRSQEPAGVQAAAQPAPLFVPVTWYVATTGNDTNSCSAPASPCATINAAIGKAANGDTIKVTTGTYTGTGPEVVLINKSLTLSGGWDAGFSAQNGMSTIDGQGVRRGITLSTGTAFIDGFAIQNGYHITDGGGIKNTGILTLNNSIVTHNTSIWMGGGIYNAGTLTINNTAITGNRGGSSTGSGGGGGGGIQNYSGILTLNNSSVIANTLVGGYSGSGINAFGTVILNNSTVSNNSGGYGEGIYAIDATIALNNSTVSGNQTYGLENIQSTVTLKNTIISGNGAADCYNNVDGYSGTVTSQGYNLITNPQVCTFTPTTGDIINVPANLGSLIGFPGYVPLLQGSPAIDAGNPATPGSDGSACLATDGRGVTRPVGARCDIGAYEYTVPGAATKLFVVSGNNQHAAPNTNFANPLVAAALDAQGSPVSNVTINFTAPSTGASGKFTDTNNGTTTAITNTDGLATTALFSANSELGSYILVASKSGASSANFVLQNVTLYVATTGNDSNSCATPASPCATINGAIAKATDGDGINVAVGVYVGSGAEVVLVDKSVTISGGMESGLHSSDWDVHHRW